MHLFDVLLHYTHFSVSKLTITIDFITFRLYLQPERNNFAAASRSIMDRQWQRKEQNNSNHMNYFVAMLMINLNAFYNIKYIIIQLISIAWFDADLVRRS